MKIILAVFISGLIFFLFSFYIFVLPPKVTNSIFLNQVQGVALNVPLTIRFDKPVDRQKLQHLITPEAYGEWSFEDSLIKNHLFRTLIFTPAVGFEPGIQYQVKLENIVGPFGIGPASNFSFNFKTKELPSKENFPEETQFKNSQNIQADIVSHSRDITILDIPLDWQDDSLSCEAASLKMALSGKSIYVSEDDIMKKIGYDQTKHKGDTWGDPYQAYVGDIDGKMCSTGFGVFWEPVSKAASNWREAEAFSNWEIQDITREIKLGNPIVIWGTLPVTTLTDCSWYTPDGKYIRAYQETHVRLVIGFIGDVENPSQIILNDPLAGRLYWSVDYFLTNWESFGYSGVVIR